MDMTIFQRLRWSWHRLVWWIKNCEFEAVLFLARFVNDRYGNTKIGGSIANHFLIRSIDILKWKDMELAWQDEFMIELGAAHKV